MYGKRASGRGHEVLTRGVCQLWRFKPVSDIVFQPAIDFGLRLFICDTDLKGRLQNSMIFL